MLKTPQINGDLSKIKKPKFPHNSDFEFDKHRLNYNYIEITPNPKAILFYFHEMYCNSNDGGLLAQIVSKKCGINVYGLDFINAGKSQSDQPGYYKSMQYLIEQAHSFVQFILTRFKNPPKIFVSGASMGGMMSFQLSVRYPKLVSGAVMLGPALRQIYSDKVIAKKIGSCLSCIMPKGKIVAQTFDDRTRFKMESFIKEDADSYSGPHVFATTASILEEMKWVSSNFKKMQTPYIVFQGGIDKYVDPFGPIDLQRQSLSQDKTTIIYKDMWHQIPHEPEHQQICQMSANWIKARI